MAFCNSRMIATTVGSTVKRKAPSITTKELESYLTDYYNMTIGKGDIDDYLTQAKEKGEFLREIIKKRLPIDAKGFYSEWEFISDDEAFGSIKSDGSAPSLLGFKMLSNNIPIYGFLMGGKLECPFFCCLYWNGKKLRTFIPISGNTVNYDFYTAFGSESGTAKENPMNIVQDYENLLKADIDNIKCSKIKNDELAYFQPGIAYCLINRYAPDAEAAFDVLNTVSWKYIRNEIEIDIQESDDEDDSEEGYVLLVKKEEEPPSVTIIKEEDEYDDEDEDDEYNEEDDAEDDADDAVDDDKDDGADDDPELLETISFVLPITEEEKALEFKNLNMEKSIENHNFCNNKRSTIRFGKISAKKMKPEKFQGKLNEYYDSVAHHAFDYTENQIELAKDVMLMSDVLVENIDFATIKASESRVCSTEGNPLLGFNILPNNVPFFGMEVGEKEESFFVALFFDGKNIVPYIPIYGNTFNSDFRTIFGSELSCHNKEKIIKLYEKKLKTSIALEDSRFLTECYFKVMGHEDLKDLNHKGSWSAMLEDLCFAIQ